MKVLITSGHGNLDVGSIGADRGYEKDRTKELANLVATKLKQAGHTVTVVEEKTEKSKVYRFCLRFFFLNFSCLNNSFSNRFRCFNICLII